VWISNTYKRGVPYIASGRWGAGRVWEPSYLPKPVILDPSKRQWCCSVYVGDSLPSIINRNNYNDYINS